MAKRTPLRPQLVIEAAAALADAEGLSAVSMRGVAKRLGVEAMSLYHHIKNKDELLNLLTEWVFENVDHLTPPAGAEQWRAWFTDYASELRATLSAHPWALGLVNSRPAPGPAQLRHIDAPLGVLFAAGFDVAEAIHTLSAVDAYVFGFVTTSDILPFSSVSAVEEKDFSPELLDSLAEYPNLARVAHELMTDASFTYGDEFRHGLDMLLNDVERRRGDAV